jgi:signal transduction histidine kinase
VSVLSGGRDNASVARRSTRAAFLLLILVIVALGAAGAYSVHRIYTLGNTRYLTQAAPLFAATQDVLVQMLNEETGVRGYELSGNPIALQPYQSGKTQIARELDAIGAYAAVDPRIPAQLAEARRDVATLERFYAQQIALVRSGPAGRRRAQGQLLAGKARFDRFRALALGLEADAGSVVQQAQHEQHGTYVKSVVFLAVAVLIGVLIASILLLRIPSRLYRLYRSEAEARRAAEEGAEAARALAHVAEAVIVADDEDGVRYWNPGAARLFGVDGDAAIGRPLGEVAPAALAALATLGSTTTELDGRARWLSAAESRFDGGRVIVVRDLTPDYELERVRSEFVATAAHELRTPLAAIYGAVRTIRRPDHDLTPQAHETFLAMIEQESERLRRLMDQLLASAQLDRESLDLSLEPCDLGALCRSIAESAELRLPGTVHLDAAFPAEPVTVDADPLRLRQAIENLLDNAVKYSPEGGRIALEVSRRNGAGVVRVTDEGIGIPLDERARIFEKFYRLDPSMTRGVGGSGLGLYIIRELVTQMGGEVEVESELGRGSVFTITLPLR